jgi:hypothetical protein
MTQSAANRADGPRNNSAAVHKVAIATAAPDPGNTRLALSTYIGWGVPGLCMLYSVLIEGGEKYEYLRGQLSH